MRFIKGKDIKKIRVIKKNSFNKKNKQDIYYKYFKNKYLCILSIIILLTSIFVITPTIKADPDDPWYDPSWSYRKEITIDHTKVTENLVNFPILINITDNDLFLHAKSNGYDIVFTDINGTKLSHEIESYNSTNGHLLAWINIPSLSATVDMSIYMYYGNPSASNQQNIEDTWNSGFKAVYHLKESWSTTTGHFKDSTINHYNGTLKDANGNSFSDIGVVGNGFRFYGDADYINIGVINHNYPITYSCWFKADNIDDNKCAFGRYWTGYYLGTWNWGSGYLRNKILINSNWNYYKHTTGSSNVWYHMAVTYDGATVRYYVNSLEVGNSSVSGNLSFTTSPWHIGDDGNAELFFKGVVDEVRLANVCFSSGWISTYYLNLNSPSTFYTIGAEEGQGTLYTLSLTTSGTGAGTIEASPSKIYYNYGETVTIWANASIGSTFTGFSGSLSGVTTPQILIIDGNESVDASFTLNTYTLTLTTSGNGDGTIEANSTGPYYYGDSITIWANASNESIFTGFTGSLTGTTTPQTLTFDGDEAVDATFMSNGPYTLQLTTSGNGNGTIEASPSSGPYYYGQTVTIWANASNESIFTGFTGSLTGTTTPQTITMDGNKSVDAAFTLNITGSGNWWNTEWLYRKQITIPHTSIDQNHTNFPVLIDITSADLIAHVQSDADDIVFTNQSGGQIYHYEIESYNETNGHLIAWVNITHLSLLRDTIFYMYYGNSTCSSQQNVAGTWNSAFDAVYHLKESWSTTTGHFKDSTVHHQNGTLTDVNSNSVSDTGKIGKGFRFNGDADYINIGIINHNQPITYSCWFKADNIDSHKCAFGRYWNGYYLGTSNDGPGYLQHGIFINSNWGYYKRTFGSSNVWYHMAVTYDGNTIRYYINGSLVGRASETGSLSATTSPWHIGDDGNAELFFKGVVDEVRIANICFSDGWISTYYRNVNNPSLFYVVGAEETQGHFALILTTSGTGLGTIQANPTGPYCEGVVVTIWANASADSTFVGFSGSLTGTTTPQILTIDGDKTVDAALTTLSLQFISPTPDDGETINTQTATINVSATRNLSNCTVSLVSYGNDNNSFTISLDQNMINLWGFKYPVTYIFNLNSIPSNAEVVRRDHLTDPWKPLDKKTTSDFFNGVECVRFNSTSKKAYVSVGFDTTNTIYLKFENVTSVVYDSVAKYYDNRKATYTLSEDNWGNKASSNPGATWQGMTNDTSDKYQASLHACRLFKIPVSVMINSQMAGGASMWDRMQDELNYSDNSWEPAVHTRTHPLGTYTKGYVWEILGNRDDILENLTNIPYGQHIFEFGLSWGYLDRSIESTTAGEFLFLRNWAGHDNSFSKHYGYWDSTYNYYFGGLETKSYDNVFQARTPAGRYYAYDVNILNNAFNTVYNNGGIFYAMFHPEFYKNSVIYDPTPGVDGVSGSSFMQHLVHVANRTNVWYVANGWMYSYRYVAENVMVSQGQMLINETQMTIENNDSNTYAFHTFTNLNHGTTYQYYVTATDILAHIVRIPPAPSFRYLTIS